MFLFYSLYKFIRNYTENRDLLCPFLKREGGSMGKKNRFLSGFKMSLKKDYKRNKFLYWITIPILIYFILFSYLPMFGIVIAFKEYKPALGIFQSPNVGLKNFSNFFGSYYFATILKNTLTISLATLAFGFPAPIILALLLNEVRFKKFKKAVQTITYMPHFISTVVMSGIIIDMVSSKGIVTQALTIFGVKAQNLLSRGSNFLPIYVISEIWQNIGWGTIIYLSALAGISQEIYEAAEIDGAGRFRKILHVSLPGIAPTIVVLLIMRLGSMMNVGWEKIVLLYNPSIYKQSDVIASFVYRMGMEKANYSYATAIGLFNSLINTFLLFMANKLSKKVNDTSIW